jgi:Ni2+-binding GTPase involved in maturation of urease and hydrogenase
VVVASPPGAGKTRLVIHLAEQLNRRAALTVAIATQTRAQTLDLANRAAAIGARVAMPGPSHQHHHARKTALLHVESIR